MSDYFVLTCIRALFSPYFMFDTAHDKLLDVVVLSCARVPVRELHIIQQLLI